MVHCTARKGVRNKQVFLHALKKSIFHRKFGREGLIEDLQASVLLANLDEVVIDAHLFKQGSHASAQSNSGSCKGVKRRKV